MGGRPDDPPGVVTAGFPNFHTITGPHSPSVLSNMMVSIEQHVDWIADLVTYMRDQGYRSIEATPEAQTGWVEHSLESARRRCTRRRTRGTWARRARQAAVFLPYIGGCGPDRYKCDEVAANGYEGFKLA